MFFLPLPFPLVPFLIFPHNQLVGFAFWLDAALTYSWSLLVSKFPNLFNFKLSMKKILKLAQQINLVSEVVEAVGLKS